MKKFIPRLVAYIAAFTGILFIAACHHDDDHKPLAEGLMPGSGTSVSSAAGSSSAAASSSSSSSQGSSSSHSSTSSSSSSSSSSSVSMGTATLHLTFNFQATTHDWGGPGAIARRKVLGGDLWVFKDWPQNIHPPAQIKTTFEVPGARSNDRLLIQPIVCYANSTNCGPDDRGETDIGAVWVQLDANLKPACDPVFTFTGVGFHTDSTCE